MYDIKELERVAFLLIGLGMVIFMFILITTEIKELNYHINQRKGNEIKNESCKIISIYDLEGMKCNKKRNNLFETIYYDCEDGLEYKNPDRANLIEREIY